MSVAGIAFVTLIGVITRSGWGWWMGIIFFGLMAIMKTAVNKVTLPLLSDSYLQDDLTTLGLVILLGTLLVWWGMWALLMFSRFRGRYRKPQTA